MLLGIEILESIPNQFQTKFFEFKQFPHLFGETVYTKVVDWFTLNDYKMYLILQMLASQMRERKRIIELIMEKSNIDS
jgi:hypothetical protein